MTEYIKYLASLISSIVVVLESVGEFHAVVNLEVLETLSTHSQMDFKAFIT